MAELRAGRDDAGLSSPIPSGGRQQEARQTLRVLRDGGWAWSETTAGLLVNPGDVESHVWHDPPSGDLRFSPKVVEMMAELLWEEAGGFH